MGDYINTDEVDALLILLEESTRASQNTAEYFIEPAQGTLNRARAARHQIIFGRRGSGKSSLLNKIHAENIVSRTPSAFIDLEKFKGAIYPDVLLSILIETFTEYQDWLNGAAVTATTKKSFWQTFTNLKPTKRIADKSKARKLANRIEQEISHLNELLFREEKIAHEDVNSLGSESSSEMQSELSFETLGVSADARAKLAEARNDIKTRKLIYESQKHTILQRKILVFSDLFKELKAVSGKEVFLILDDLYHLKRVDQADVLDYFHKLSKGGRYVLKIGTVRHRTEHYRNGDPPVGMKLSDDASEIDLDVTLEKYATTKAFLLKVLKQYAVAKNAKVDALITSGAIDRLVLSSGGVARDFLSLFRNSVEQARERIEAKNVAPGIRVSSQDVNRASGKYYDDKLQELERDAGARDKNLIEEDIAALRNFCMEIAKSNCVLVEKERGKVKMFSIGELVDLKILHPIRSGITVSKRQGKRYDAFMLDYSFYTGDRTKRGITFLEFWKPNASDEILRKVSLIYDDTR